MMMGLPRCRLPMMPTMTLAVKIYIHIRIHMKYIYYCCHCCLHAATADDAAGVLLSLMLQIGIYIYKPVI